MEEIAPVSLALRQLAEAQALSGRAKWTEYLFCCIICFMTEIGKFTAQYERSVGLHNFTTVDSTPVAAVAVPTWEEFQQTLVDLPPTKGYVISPELITSPGYLTEIENRATEIQERTDEIQALSKQQPDALILLGTATFDRDNSLVRNSLAVISDGETRGYIDKRGGMLPLENQIFSKQPRQQATLLSAGHTALICSDIIWAMSFGRSDRKKNDWIPPHVETLLVSSCWAVPQSEGPTSPSLNEERFKDALERTIRKLFERYHNLKEVVMVDRVIPDSQVEPYTAQFRRVVPLLASSY